MRFGEFYRRVCEQLKEGYGWRGVTIFLFTHVGLMDIIHDQYQMHAEASPLEWQGIIEATALQVDQGEASCVSH